MAGTIKKYTDTKIVYNAECINIKSNVSYNCAYRYHVSPFIISTITTVIKRFNERGPAIAIVSMDATLPLYSDCADKTQYTIRITRESERPKIQSVFTAIVNTKGLGVDWSKGFNLSMSNQIASEIMKAIVPIMFVELSRQSHE